MTLLSPTERRILDRYRKIYDAPDRAVFLTDLARERKARAADPALVADYAARISAATERAETAEKEEA